MFNFGAILKGFRDIISKKDVSEDIILIRDKLKKETIPPYEAAAERFGKRKFTSKSATEFDARFKATVTTRYNGNFINATLSVLKTMSDKLDIIEDILSRRQGSDIAREAMSVIELNVIRYAEVSSFVLDYARKILLLVMYAEVSNATTGMNGGAVSTSEFGNLTPADVEYVNKNAEEYFAAINIISKTAKDIAKAFDELPDIVLSPDNANSVVSVGTRAKVDPLGVCVIPVIGTLIYHFRLYVAEMQAENYEKAQNERKIIEYKLLQLKRMEEGKNDPALERQIEYVESRLDNINAKIEELKTKYKLG